MSVKLDETTQRNIVIIDADRAAARQKRLAYRRVRLRGWRRDKLDFKGWSTRQSIHRLGPLPKPAISLFNRLLIKAVQMHFAQASTARAIIIIRYGFSGRMDTQTFSHTSTIKLPIWPF